MAHHQPDDVFIATNSDNEFNNLDEKLTLFSYSQADNSVFYSPIYSGLHSPPTESLALNDPHDVTNENVGVRETSSVEHLLEFDITLFPEVQLGESSMDLFDDPIDEDTATTTTFDVTNDNNNSTPTELNLVPDVTETATKIVPERINLKSVDRSIQETLLSVIIQPTNNPRRRYKCEGKRRIKKLCSNLLTIDLSKLQQYTLDPNQSLWLRLSLITHSDDVLVDVYIHPDKFTDFSGVARVEIDGSVCVRITQSHIDDGKIELKDLSVIKKKDNTYTFALIPYSISKIDNESETYVIDKTKRIVGNAKVFRKKYNLKASRIACQVLIEEDESYVFTDITCRTNVMIEQKRDPNAIKSTKRRIKKNQKLGKKRRNAIKSKSVVERKKRSNY